MNSERRSKDLPPLKDLNPLDIIYVSDPSSFPSYATHVLQPNVPLLSEFKYAIREEAEGLGKREVFKRETIPLNKRKGLNTLRSRYVNAIKNVGTPDENLKSRPVFQAVKRADQEFPNLFK